MSAARAGVLRRGWDVVPVALALAQAAGLGVAWIGATRGGVGAGAALASAVAIVVWWGSNTVAHLHLHRPFFRARAANRGLSLALTALYGVPQAIWRDRHLRHHAGARADAVPKPARRDVWLQIALVGAVWAALAVAAPVVFFAAWLPGWLAGLGLCALQGRGEHLDGDVGRSVWGGVWGRVYNVLWLNDGYHAEHHRWPGLHWRALPARRGQIPGAQAPCRVPPVVRALPAVAGGIVPALLGALERRALGRPAVQRWLVRAHARAFSRALGGLRPRRVLIVGGGLFPRTVRVLREVVPEAELVVVDASAAHLAVARAHLAALGVHGVAFERASWAPGARAARLDADLVVLPLAFAGDRRARFTPRADGVPRLVHDWVWGRAPGRAARVSWWLMKRVVLIEAAAATAPARGRGAGVEAARA